MPVLCDDYQPRDPDQHLTDGTRSWRVERGPGWILVSDQFRRGKKKPKEEDA